MITPEYETWFSLPKEAKSTGGFYEDVQKLILDPLQKAGYYLLNSWGEEWEFEKGDIRLSLEYHEHADGFRLLVLLDEDGDEVKADFLKHTALQEWQE